MFDVRLLALAVAAGVASLVAFQYAYMSGVSAVVASPSTGITSPGTGGTSPSAQVNSEVAKLEREAAKKHPGKSRAEGIALVAAEKASQELNAISDPKERAFKAAQIFLGYYLINARGRADYCESKGVDISPFVNAFAQRYAREYRLAGDILHKRGIDVEQSYRQLKPAMERMVNTEMNGLAGFQATHKKVCETFAKQPGFYLNQIDLQVRQPDVYRALYPS